MAALSTNYLLLCLIYNYLESSLASIRLIYRGGWRVQEVQRMCMRRCPIKQHLASFGTPWNRMQNEPIHTWTSRYTRVHGTPSPGPTIFFSPNCVFQVHGKTHNLSDSKARHREREREWEKQLPRIGRGRSSRTTTTVNARVHFPGQTANGKPFSCSFSRLDDGKSIWWCYKLLSEKART